jgi:hypothetical protein
MYPLISNTESKTIIIIITIVIILIIIIVFVIMENITPKSIDCKGSWGACNANCGCGTKIYTITKEKAGKVDGIVNVGDVVDIPLHEVDQTKVDGKNITAVVVEVLKSRQVRCACFVGILDRSYARHQVSVLQGVINNGKVCGLEKAFHGWQGLPKTSLDKIIEREVVRQTSLVGRQGLHVSFGCKVKCVTKCCKCKAKNAFCNFKYHRGNTCCLNHDS